MATPSHEAEQGRPRLAGRPKVTARPRVRGDRRDDVLDVVLRLLIEQGYDRLTLDEVAAEARVSKATLYRHWTDKARLVLDAVSTSPEAQRARTIDTGSLVGDLIAFFSGPDSERLHEGSRLLGALMSALHHDQQLAGLLRGEYLPGIVDHYREFYRRAHRRGELAAGTDITLVSDALPGILLYQSLVLGQRIDTGALQRAIDCVIRPWLTDRDTTGSTRLGPGTEVEEPARSIQRPGAGRPSEREPGDA